MTDPDITEHGLSHLSEEEWEKVLEGVSRPPTWQECEDAFWESRAQFGVNMDKYRQLDAKYLRMLDAYEKARS